MDYTLDTIRARGLPLDLQRFANPGDVVNATDGFVNAHTGDRQDFDANNTFSPSMKYFYDTALLENARPHFYYAQFGKTQSLPQNKGKTVEWRKFNTLPMAKELQEGVIPQGTKFGMTSIMGGIAQYGDYSAVTDQLDWHATDNIILGLVEEQGAAAGKTLDTLVRNTLMEGTNVIYADTVDANGAYASTPTGRYQMSPDNNRLTLPVIHKAATFLEKMDAPLIDGNYVALIHPSVKFDVIESRGWEDWHKYTNAEARYNGEIGRIDNVRFVVTTQAAVWSGKPLDALKRYLTPTATYIENDSTATAPIGEATKYKLTISETPGKEHIGRYVHVWDADGAGASAGAYVSTVKIVGADAANKYIWFDVGLGIEPTTSDRLFPGEGAAEATNGNSGAAVYGCLFLGREAYALINPQGAGLETIMKAKSQIGGPLDQFSTVGYKVSTGSKILYQERMVRVECCSFYSNIDETN